MHERSHEFMIIRLAKMALALAVGLWGLFGAMGNILDWAGTTGSVSAVTSMARFEGGAEDWRATDSAFVILAGAVFIVAFKSVTAILASVALWKMARALRAGAAEFAAAKSMAVAACMVGVFGLFFGWIVIGEGWYEFWRDPGFGGLEGAGIAAFRYGGFLGLIALLLAQPND